MELLKFDRAPETSNQEHVIEMLESVIAKAKRGEVALAVIVTADEDYNVSFGFVTDSPLEVPGLLQVALQDY